MNPGFPQPPSPVPVSGQPSGYHLQLVEGPEGHAVAITVHTPGGSSTTFVPVDYWATQLWPLLERTNEAVRAARAGVTPVMQQLILPPRNGHPG